MPRNGKAALLAGEEVKFNLRLGKELYDWLVTYANEEERSANAQIVQLIKEKRARQQAAKQAMAALEDNDQA